MELNADFDQRAFVHAARIPWKASPIPGVERRMLDRLGDEVARATSIVRYAPGSQFSPHIHTGGEEYLVLEGVFQDEHGDFPTGTYVRNPPQSSHTPGSDRGCTIFVKLWQFDMQDRKQVRIDTGDQRYMAVPGRPGVDALDLHTDSREQVSMEKWAPGITMELAAKNGMELLVVEGGFDEGGEAFGVHSWLRLPRGSVTRARAGKQGAKVWIKRGHLAETPRPPATGNRNTASHVNT